MQRISVNKAIGRGLVMVYGPFFPLVLGIPALVLLLTTPFHLSRIFSLLSFPIGILIAWIWWSYHVPRWRIWALQHVDDIEALHQRAVQIGIEWPYGHFFEQTEIKTRQQLLQEAVLQLRHYLQHLQRIVSANDNSNDLRNLTEELDKATVQIIAEQVVEPSILVSLEQSLRQCIAQGQCESANVATFANTIYVMNKYQRASRRFQSKT